jgi:hypothetical protein
MIRFALIALLLSPAQVPPQTDQSRLFAPCQITPWALPTHVKKHLV